MRRILFVDDNEHVLQGLRRTLRDRRDEWDTEFVTGPSDALAAMERQPFDVVVSDLRMPGMDGPTFMDRIRQRFPRTARIILSGSAGPDEILRSASASHQFLAKPCDPDVLKSTVDRVCALNELLHGDAVRGIVSGVDALPSMPSLFQEVSALAQDPDSSLARVSEVIARDLSMSATILKLVNSAYFGVPQKVDSVQRAVSLLGLDTIRALILGTSVFREYRPAAPGFTVEALWEHSLRVAGCARAIARLERATADAVGHTYLAALFHDVGKLILACHDGGHYTGILARVAKGERASMIEQEVYGATHAEVGAYLLGLWNFPDAVVRAVAFHHRPAEACEAAASPTVWVHVADAIAAAESAKPSILDTAYLDREGLTSRLRGWESACARVVPGTN